MGGVLESFCGGGMGTEFRIEVSEDSDANGVTHVVIVLERVGVVGGSRLGAWCGAVVWDGSLGSPHQILVIDAALKRRSSTLLQAVSSRRVRCCWTHADKSVRATRSRGHLV